MTQTLRAVYRDGKFEPLTAPTLPEGVEVELTIESPPSRPPVVTDPEERKKILDRLIESMNNNPIPANAPRKFTREELHERR